MRQKRKKWRQWVVVLSVVVINTYLCFITFSRHNDVIQAEREEGAVTNGSTNSLPMASRVELLSQVCDSHHGDPRLHSEPQGPGVEVVLLPGDPPVTVCIPHKVGSHAWGVFSRQLAELYPARVERLRAMPWRRRAAVTKKAVVVRHPLERLVSAYRMLFQVSLTLPGN